MKRNIFITTIFICIFLSIIFINIISKRILPVFMEYVISDMKNISTSIINNTITKELESFDDDIVIISKNNEDDIQMIDYNSKLVNKMLTNLTKEVIINLKEIEKGNSNISLDKINIGDDMVYEIPLGRFTNNIFIGNIGPKIPVKFNIVGDAHSNIKTIVKEYGINNALVEIIVNILVTERVIMPFISKSVDIDVDVPVSIKLIKGEIPIYYGAGIYRNSNILSIPTE